MRRVKRTPLKRARCTICRWSYDEPSQTKEQAKAHNWETGHTTTYEWGHATDYDGPAYKEKNP